MCGLPGSGLELISSPLTGRFLPTGPPGKPPEHDFTISYMGRWELLGFPGGSVVKNLPANAGDVGSIRGQEGPLEKEMATHSSILIWEVSWTEETGRLQSMDLQESQI